MNGFDDFVLVSWNIRGASNKVTRRYLREMTRRYRPSVFMVYETHVAFSATQDRWSTLGFKPLFIQEARGHAGEIWVLSNHTDFVFQLVDSTPHFITFSIRKRVAEWFCSGVYASPNPSLRVNLWNYLISLRGNIKGPWMMAGDMNEILNATEVDGGNFIASKSNLFRNVVDSCDFIDVQAVRGFYTW